MDRSLPGFDVAGGSLDLTVYEHAHAVPSTCRNLSAVQAEDGMMGSARWSYDGTRPRALAKLKDAAFRAGGNAVLLDDPQQLGYIGFDGARGSIVVLTGQALDCQNRLGT